MSVQRGEVDWLWALLISLLYCVDSISIPECQDLSTCPVCFNNTMEDWDGTTPVMESELKDFMVETQAQFMDIVNAKTPNTATAFDGAAGRALLYLRIYDDKKNDTALGRARAYAEEALQAVHTLNLDYVGFLWGATGVYAVAAAVLDRAGNESERVCELVDNVRSIFATAPQMAPYDDWDSGRSGLLYAAHFLKENVKHAPANCTTIEQEAVKAVAEAIVTRGAALARGEGYMEFISPNDGGRWLGQSHGSAGVCHGLISYAPEVFRENATARALILGTLDHIASKQMPSGNFPSEYYDDDADELVQWDHGAPGIMTVLAHAALEVSQLASNGTLAWPDAQEYVERYTTSAVKAADCTWERGLLTKGLQMCHGIVGNTYQQLRLAALIRELNSRNDTGVEPDRFTWRALQFQRFVMRTPELNDPQLMRKPTPDPFAVYTASYESASVIFQDLASHSDYPFDVRGMLAY